MRAGLAGLYERFPARTGREKPADCLLAPGEYGCFCSHHDLLASVQPDGRFVHVLEDDAIVARVFGPAVQSMLDRGMLEPFDIVFTETMIKMNLGHIRDVKSLFDRNFVPGKPLSLTLIGLGGDSFMGTTSYFVNPRSLGRVVDALKRGLDAGPLKPLDHYYCDEARAGRLKIGLVFPFLSSIRVQMPSTIRLDSAIEMALLLLRNTFFIEADIQANRRALANIFRQTTPSQPDPRLDFISDFLRFTVANPGASEGKE